MGTSRKGPSVADAGSTRHKQPMEHANSGHSGLRRRERESPSVKCRLPDRIDRAVIFVCTRSAFAFPHAFVLVGGQNDHAGGALVRRLNESVE